MIDEHESSYVPQAGARRTGQLIVVGLDGSNTSWDAFSWAVGQAARTRGSLIAVFVTPIGEPTAGMAAPYAHAAAEETRELVGAELEHEARQRADESGIELNFVHEHGDAVEALTKVACAAHADLVVVGRSMKRRHHVMGSLGRRLVSRADAPVIVVVP
ncbi:universal stress protein [Jatrophihabitans sp.]|uniref:universal stress protein n=1 Tax=Jatrophihabitans sp. TaxID=1932789 RepID=UPI0030C76F9A|nr:hypothetical protein [Jatrophihabitans sp.]